MPRDHFPCYCLTNSGVELSRICFSLLLKLNCCFRVCFRRNANRERAAEQLERLKDQLLLQQFLQECDELRDWLHDKMAAAQDETYRDAKNLHSKYLRHQAFEREIAANKDRLLRLQEVGILLMYEGQLFIKFCNLSCNL